MGLLVLRRVSKRGHHGSLPAIDELLAHAVGHLADIEARTGVVDNLAHHQLGRLVLGGLQDAGFGKRFQHAARSFQDVLHVHVSNRDHAFWAAGVNVARAFACHWCKEGDGQEDDDGADAHGGVDRTLGVLGDDA